MWELTRHSSPKARKDHVCDECYKPILKGDKYERIDGKWEGAMISHKCHMDCAALCNKIYKNDGLDAYDEYPRLDNYVFEKEYQDGYIGEFKEVFARFGITQHNRDNERD